MQFEKTTKPTELKENKLLRKHTIIKKEQPDNNVTSIQWYETIVNSLPVIGRFLIYIAVLFGIGLLYYYIIVGEIPKESLILIFVKLLKKLNLI
ncbi:hypothetical protein [Cytobacillus kochii]|uniref:hypothetical protein n=1 Tax=Cytobacillus kochii TaxID=859143 RepID=UPI002040DC24|nr:hypothetical protein [Cytobacillus kochii]MCM3322704.1 hypothetical protein [Cytobacillus kochii]MCM3344817.1 hypothetical protein [Cytobacillus kochii]